MLVTSPAQDAEVSGIVREPCYVIAIELDQPYFWSTRQEVTFDDMQFIPGFIERETFKLKNDELSFSFYNEDYVHTDNARAGVYARKRVRVWWAYGHGSDPEETYPDPILRFDGMIYETPLIDQWISVVAGQTPPERVPGTRLRPPYANHLPSPGYTVQFDGAILRVEGR